MRRPKGNRRSRTAAVALLAVVGVALAPQTASATPTLPLLLWNGPDFSFANFVEGSTFAAAGQASTVDGRGIDRTDYDDDSPGVEPSGTLSILTDHYLREGVFEAKISATDEGNAGMASIKLVDGRGRPIGSPANAPGCPAACPERFVATFRVDIADFRDGAHDVVAVATDAAGNSNNAVVNLFYVDTVGPGPVTGIREDEYRSDTEQSIVRWVTPNDPDLPNGSLGSGSAPSKARYKVGTGQFTRWRLVEDEQLVVPAADGAKVTVEIRSRDDAGNDGPSVSVTYAAGSSEQP